MGLMEPDDWTLLARCRGMEDALFPEGKDQKRARVVCMGCPVRSTCLAEALDNRIEWGVWGGLTERERRQLLRQRPDVPSWAAVLESADDIDVVTGRPELQLLHGGGMRRRAAVGQRARA
ncbi:WhiB family transcriptional regulator [Luteococcus sp. OSA5]|uniref:WhiB family transcriptional regulator n=1 Tax=Luteococcus sp. OSA5 TaxID=3401630 RepID=UPI003B42FAF3